MQHLDKAPAEAQINLLKALNKSIDIYKDHIIMRMYVSEPAEEISCDIGEAIKDCETETTLQGSPERQQWRRGRDSNPRYPEGYN